MPIQTNYSYFIGCWLLWCSFDNRSIYWLWYSNDSIDNNSRLIDDDDAMLLIRSIMFKFRFCSCFVDIMGRALLLLYSYFKFEDSIRFKFHYFAATSHRLGRALLLFMLLLLIRLRFFATNTDPDTVPSSDPAEALQHILLWSVFDLFITTHLLMERVKLWHLLLIYDLSYDAYITLFCSQYKFRFSNVCSVPIASVQHWY